MPRAKLGNAASDRAAGQASRHRRRSDPAMLLRHGFVRREQSPPTFVEKLLRLPPAQPDVVNVDHTLKLASYVASCLANSRFYSCVLRLTPIRLFLGGP